MTLYGPVTDFPIRDRIVAVTGGGSGIGFSFAKLCHERGARVLLGDLKLTAEAEAYISAVNAQDQLAFETCDVTSWKSLESFITASVTHFGDVPDVYAPVAGIFEPPWSNFWDDTEAEFYKTVRINVEHPVKLTRLAMRALAGAQKQGVVCLVASTAGIRGNYIASLYATSKHAVVGFTKSMGQADIEEGVKIVAVLPGMVQTPLWTDREDDAADRMKYKERPGLQPIEIADLMLKLVESKEYGGGTCMLKTPLEERIEEISYAEGIESAKYDPSPRPDADIGHLKDIFANERGKKWHSST